MQHQYPPIEPLLPRFVSDGGGDGGQIQNERTTARMPNEPHDNGHTDATVQRETVHHMPSTHATSSQVHPRPYPSHPPLNSSPRRRCAKLGLSEIAMMSVILLLASLALWSTFHPTSSTSASRRTINGMNGEMNDRSNGIPASLIPSAKPNVEWWQRVMSIDKDVDRIGMDAEIAFIGDSITEMWLTNALDIWQTRYEKPYAAVNMGVGGDQTQHLLWRLGIGSQLPHLSSKLRVIILLIGTNNSASGEQPMDTLHAIYAIVQLIRKELARMDARDCRIIVLNIFPTSVMERAIPNQQINAQLKSTIEQADRNVFVHDINDAFIDHQQHQHQHHPHATQQWIWDDPSSPPPPINKTLFMDDGLHLNHLGYQAWADALDPIIQQYIP